MRNIVTIPALKSHTKLALFGDVCYRMAFANCTRRLSSRDEWRQEDDDAIATENFRFEPATKIALKSDKK